MKPDRDKVYAKYGGRCAYCGEEIAYEQMQVDHLFPKQLAHWLQSPVMCKTHNITITNIDDPENLMPSCAKCNNFKSYQMLEDFRKALEDQVNQLNKTSTQYARAKRYGLVIETGAKVVFYFEKKEK